MIDIEAYKKIEAIEELSDYYTLIIAYLDARIALDSLRIQMLGSKLRLDRPANVKAGGYLRLIGFKKESHLHEISKITYQHYQNGLHERLNDILKGKV